MTQGEEKTLKLLDATCGYVLSEVFGIFTYRRNIPKEIRKVLFIRPGGIGDAVLLCPAIKKLIEKRGVLVDVLAETRNALAFELCRGLNKIYVYDRNLEILKPILNKYDVVIDTEQWYRLSAVAAFFCRGKTRIGFSTNNRYKLFNYTVNYDRHDYEAYNFLKLITPLLDGKMDYRIDVPFLDIPDSIKRWAAFLLQKRKTSDMFIVVLFPGASKKEKRWPPEKFAALAQRLESRGCKIVLVGGDGDRELSSQIKKKVRNAVDLTGMTNLLQTAAIIGEADLFISADSGLLHIAYGLGIPTVSLFGPGSSEKWGPRGEMHIIISKPFPCVPCSMFGRIPHCPYNNKCMKSIEVDEVERAALSVLEKRAWKRQSSLKV